MSEHLAHKFILISSNFLVQDLGTQKIANSLKYAEMQRLENAFTFFSSIFPLKITFINSFISAGHYSLKIKFFFFIWHGKTLNCIIKKNN